jgi:hypothetical protein
MAVTEKSDRGIPVWVISSGSFVDSEFRYLQDCGLPTKDGSASLAGIRCRLNEPAFRAMSSRSTDEKSPNCEKFYHNDLRVFWPA